MHRKAEKHEVREAFLSSKVGTHKRQRNKMPRVSPMTDKCVQISQAGKGDRDPIFDPIRTCLAVFSRFQILLSLFLSLETVNRSNSCFLPILLRSDETNKDLQRRPQKLPCVL